MRHLRLRSILSRPRMLGMIGQIIHDRLPRQSIRMFLLQAHLCRTGALALNPEMMATYLPLMTTLSRRVQPKRQARASAVAYPCLGKSLQAPKLPQAK